MKWNKTLPAFEDKDEYFIVSDGENLSLARWSNLISDDPECGADHDEFEFKNDMFCKIEPIFWYGPILKYGKFNLMDISP